MFNRAYKNNRENLFLNTFCPLRIEEGWAISSFFIRALVYFAFFRDDFKSEVSINIRNSSDKAS